MSMQDLVNKAFEAGQRSTLAKPVPHRWIEAIKAWADGHQVQWAYIAAKNKQWTTHVDESVPDFNNLSLIWRIKPETKTGWIAIRNSPSKYTSCTHIYSTRSDALAVCDLEDVEAAIQVTWEEGEGL